MSDATIGMTDAELIERLRAIARQRQQQPLEAFRIPLETHSEWIAADRIVSLLQEADDTKRILSDPVTVHLNMLSGTIAKISMENCAHVHGIQFNDLEAAEAALASRLEQNETLAGQLAAAMEEIASLRQSLAETEGRIRHLEQALAREANRRERAEEELECLHMVLDDRRVPTEIDGNRLSLVGRVDAYVTGLRAQIQEREQ